MKNFILICTVVLCSLSSCTLSELDQTSGNDSQVSFELIVEDDGTKAYLNDYDTNWEYLWENGDEINYIVASNNSIKSSGTGVVNLTGQSTKIELNTSYSSGNVLYAWYAPGNPGSNPSSVRLSIPSTQVSDYTRESFTANCQQTLSIDDVSLDKTVYTTSTTTKSSSKAPETRKVTFTIGNYNPACTYYCKIGSGSATKLAPSTSGQCTVNVTFGSISFSTKSSSASGSSSTTFYVYCSGQETTKASATIKASGTKTTTTSGGFFGWGAKTTYNYSFTYSISANNSGSQIVETTTYGDYMMTPVHDAMPLVAKPVSITSSMLSKGSPVNYLSFSMLGAGIAWQLYTSNTSVGIGETIQSVSFTSNGQAISGEFDYNLKNNPLTVSGLSEKTVVSYASDLNLQLANGKENPVTVYMIVAPGTYSGELQITTDLANYYFSVKSISYGRGVLKSLTLDLNGSTVTRVPLGEEYPETPQEPEPLTFFISSNFTNCAFGETPVESVTEGEPYTATIVPDEGCEMGDVSISMGGTAMTGAWDAATGVVSIPSVTGDVEITAEAASISVPEEPEVEHMESWSFFTSDRHGDTSAVPGILSYIKNNVTTTLDYACLIGDMVGSTGGDAPAFKTSTIESEVTGTFPDADVLISYGSHDAGATDDAGILNRSSCRGYTITYAGSDEVAYYVYSIPHDFMENTSSAQTAAPQFVSWASTLDPSKPIVVVSHVPTIAKRGDNGGAMYWHNAMNQVATGSASGTSITRNVIFFCAHNHTTDQTEWYYAPLETMKVARQTSDKTGISCKIYYTYSVAGYIKTSKSGTLMKITNDTIEISLAKYKSTGLVSGSSHTIQRVGIEADN